MPTLTATPGDGKVVLSWDNISDTKTRDPFLGNVNDFEGYKLFRATDKYFSDAEVITDGYGTPTFMKPIFQCDIKDGKYGFTDFGLINGVAYNLGTDNGLTHVFVDNSVMNGRTYYYGLVAYDYGAPNIGPGIAPSENNVVIELDEAEDVRSIGKNVAIVTPTKPAAGYRAPELTVDENNLTGGGTIEPMILAQSSLTSNNQYSVVFGVDTIDTIPNYEYGIRYSTSEINVYNTSSGSLIYSETPQKFTGSNLVENDSLGIWYLNDEVAIETDIFDGLQLIINQPFISPAYDYDNSGCVQGSGIMRVLPSLRESAYMPWDYDVMFTFDQTVYTTQTINKSGIRDELDQQIPFNQLLLAQSFNFVVKNNIISKNDGSYEMMDLVVHDVDESGDFDSSVDRILVGGLTSDKKWAGTVFVIDLTLASSATYPKADDVFRVKFKRPFFTNDNFKFTVKTFDELNADSLKLKMKDIKVVPNPYVASNVMEPAVSNQFLNQRRRLLFTNIPAQSVISIYTVSGVFVDEINVNNSPERGSIHWDMLTREGLEIAAGMYIYHVKSSVTGDEKLGKFAVIK